MVMPNGKKKSHHNELLVNAILVLGVIGTLVSIYLVKDHFDTQKSLCDLGTRVSCSIVNRSVYAKLFGVPVAIFGVTWMLVLVAFTWQIKTGEKADGVYFITAHFIWSIAGLGFCFYLIYGEIVIGALCPFCTVVHIICFIESYLAWRLYKQQKVFPTFVELLTYFFTMQMIWVLVIAGLHLVPLIFFNIPAPSEPLPDPKRLDSFAKCLTEAGVTMYGTDDCTWCSRQKELFGESFALLDYINCQQHELKCEEKKLEGMPSWIQQATDGSELKRHAGVLTLRELEQFSGCQLTAATQS
jgi:uncharacterized membrane protein